MGLFKAIKRKIINFGRWIIGEPSVEREAEMVQMRAKAVTRAKEIKREKEIVKQTARVKIQEWWDEEERKRAEKEKYEKERPSEELLEEAGYV